MNVCGSRSASAIAATFACAALPCRASPPLRIVLDEQAAERLGVGLGGEVTALGRRLRVVGLAEDTTSVITTVAFVGYETIRRTTGRVVLDPKQATLDPGLVVTGQLHHFGYDEATRAAYVRFDEALSTAGGTRVETRRFEASVPTTPEPGTIGPALNRAANQVALEVAAWIGG